VRRLRTGSHDQVARQGVGIDGEDLVAAPVHLQIRYDCISSAQLGPSDRSVAGSCCTSNTKAGVSKAAARLAGRAPARKPRGRAAGGRRCA